ncbi:MAG TPA: asparagine synthase (glutamine-hydrolyzing) [Gemmatimonadaceae bacterium]|nr:asparagine synthase (glutamine-hydrolyzing) [Gemmatimonadaceae bacterium]
MCGLVGIAGAAPAREEVAAMLATIRHRGPDGHGCRVTAGAAFGHARLAIVDLSEAGAQPMCTPDGRYTLVYNGELYNHADFRPALEAEGVCFRGHSDTETLLWLLVRHGAAVLPRLNGIFAFAFHDALTDTLLLARDQLGVKPLYYARGRDGRLLFASEIKALFATGEVEPRANVEDLVELFLFHFIAGERTAFATVTELLPGHLLQRADGRVRVAEYWTPVTAAREGPCDGAAASTPEAAAGALRDRVRDAVHRQLMADVPIGVMSSGGIDSGLVTAFATRGAARLRGFSFRDTAHDYDEFHEACRLGELFGVDVAPVTIAPDEVPAVLERAAWHYDEPIPRPHFLAAYAVARDARATGLKVLMSGEGGDEVFGGYTRYAELLAAMCATGDESALVFAHNRVALPRLARLWPGQRFGNAFRFWCAAETAGLDLVNRQLLVDQRTFLQHFLQRSDRMGMAASVEVRVPLLDPWLVEHANRLPGSAKIEGTHTKRGLKAAARTVLPASVFDRPKRGFDMPMAPLLEQGPVAAYLDDLLLAQPRCGVLFESSAIAAFVRDLRAGEAELWKVAWMLLATEVWMRTFNVTV